MASGIKTGLIAVLCLLVPLGFPVPVPAAEAQAPGAGKTPPTTPAGGEEDPDQTDEEAGLTALVTAEHDLFKLLVEKGSHLEALELLAKLHRREIPPRNAEALTVVLDSYLSGIELLQTMKEYERARAMVKEALSRTGTSDLYRGYFFMSEAELEKAQGRADKAIEALKRAISVFEGYVGGTPPRRSVPSK